MMRGRRLIAGLLAAVVAVAVSGCVRMDSLAAVLADDLALVASSATQGYLLGVLDVSTLTTP
jgi:hypothetical protein